MKYTMLVAVTAIAVEAAPTAHADIERSACRAPVQSLSALLQEWNQAGFNTPSKPAQYRVYGGTSYVTSGPGYSTMVSRIRSATNDARLGMDCGAAVNVAEASRLLASSKG
jgi:hypothetical protein